MGLILWLILMIPQLAQAATYWVDQSIGSDSRTTTQAQSESTPWATINKCATASPALVAGDFCLVKNGTYNPGLMTITTSGSAVGGPITYKAAPGHSPIMDFNPSGTAATGSVVMLMIGNNVGYVTVEGFEIRDSWQGVRCETLCHHIIIRKNRIHDTWDTAVGSMSGPDNTIDRNIIYRIGHGGTGQGMYLTGRRYTVTNNIVYDSLSSGRFGIQLAAYEFCSTSAPSMDYKGLWDSYIANNTIAYNRSSGIVLWNARNGSGVLTAGCVDGTMSGNIIENNIFHENCDTGCATSSGGQGVHCLSCQSTTNAQVRRSLWHGTSPRSVSFISGTTAELITTDTASGNPLFNNAPSGQSDAPSSPNFTLQATSPAIGTGANLTSVLSTRYGMSSPILDHSGNARPTSGPWDKGAYESGGTPPDTTPPAAPTGVSVSKLERF